MKRIISLILSVLMIAFSVPFLVSAGDSTLADELASKVGGKAKNAAFDVVITAQNEYIKEDDTVEVEVTVKNIKVPDGLVYLDFEFHYDETKLLIQNVLKETEPSLECVKSLPNENWEDICIISHDSNNKIINSGKVSVSVMNATEPTAAEKDGDIVLLFKFKVISGVTGDIGFYVTTKSVYGYNWDVDEYEGNGSYAITKQHAHSYSDKIVNPTCTEKGYTLHTCTCGDEYKDTYTDMIPHSFVNYVSDGNATCQQDGTKTAKCEHCDATDTIADEGSKTGHSFVNYVSDGNATCQQDGTKTAKCEHCDATDTITDEGSKKEHTPGEWKTVKEATADEAGLEELHCTECTELIDSREIPVKPAFVLGDVNGNGKIDTNDYVLLKRHCLKTFTLTDEQAIRSDVNGNGKIDTNDYVLLKRACLGTYKIA